VDGLARRFGEEVLGSASKRMMREALPDFARVYRVVQAELGENIGDVAALCVAIDRLKKCVSRSLIPNNYGRALFHTTGAID
jgi:hypothetical protein